MEILKENKKYLKTKSLAPQGEVYPYIIIDHFLCSITKGYNSGEK